jgi:hypothetical protein
VSTSVETRDAINAEALQLGAEIGTRVSIHDVIRAALAVAKRHRDELIRELTVQ